MENVPQVLTAPEWPSLTGRLEAMGYRNKWAKLDSSAFGSAQKRVRAFMVSRLGAEPPDLPLSSPGAPALCLRDIMEETRGERHIRRIPLDRIRWREPKEGYSHPQSEGIQAPLIDAACPRLEDRRIMAEASLSPALRASGKTTVVEEEEEERVKPLVGRADTLRMAGPGRIATLGKPPSTPAASVDGETFYAKAVIYSPLRSGPTVRCQGRHGLSNQIKVFACDDGSGALDQSIVPSRTFLDRRYYDDSGSAPCVVSSTQGRIKVVADMERPSHLDYQNRLYSSSSSSPAVIAHGGSDHEIKVAAGIEGRLKAVPPMAEGDVCPIQTPQRAKKGQNGSGIRPPNSPAYTVTTEPDGGAEISGGDLVVNILTPLECWRLMGFPYWAFRRASAVCSETQLYNQAGNSIVVEVLEAIFRAMFPPKPRRVQATLEEAAAAGEVCLTITGAGA